MIYKYSNINLIILFFIAFLSSCNKNNPDESQLPPAGQITSIEGISSSYSMGLHEYLEISPDVSLSSEGSGVAYEWNINYKKVSDKKDLRVKCSEPGTFDAYLKVSTPKGGKLVKFKVIVTTAYDKGLLLLSELDGKAVLTFKRLDKIDSKPCPYAFKDNNPNLSLGKTPLSVCWTGEGVTNPKNIDDAGGLDIVVSTGEPLKAYLLGNDDLKAKTEIIYNGEGVFRPEKIISPFGWQNSLWQTEKPVFFIGGGKEFLLNNGVDFLKPRSRHIIPEGVRLSNLSCCLITRTTDFVKVYYDVEYKRMVYVGGVGGAVVGKMGCGVEPMSLLACDGEYALSADSRYEPHNFLLVGERGGQVEIFYFIPSANKQIESLISKIEAGGRMSKDCATGVNPVRPFLYYSDEKGNIYSLNYQSNNFSSSPYIELGKNYDVKSIVFNPYSPDIMFIAAEDREEPTSLKAVIFIYDVKDKTSGKKLFEGKQAGGKVRQLIYKGNGRENVETFNF